MGEFLFDPDEFRQPGVPPGLEGDAGTLGRPRLRRPVRDQVEMQLYALDHLLDPDHPVRTVWDAVCKLDLSRWLEEIKAVEGQAGRNATDPRILVALWVFATLEGVGSGRRLDALCQEHIAYRWLCGGVSVNYHMLCDFRSQGGAKWDDLLTQLVASLLAQGLVKMNRVAQDGMRVRANAGKGSFRRKERLEEHLEAARRQVETLRQLAEESPEELSSREQAARQRAASEQQARVEEAIRQCEELQAQREKHRKKRGGKQKDKPAEARASTTDPEARVMKFADGGYRPGMNVQYATDTESGVIVGVDVTGAGNDQGQLSPMLDQLEERYCRKPQEALVDGGFASLEEVKAAAEDHDCQVYSPLKDEQKQLDAGKDPYARKKGDSDAVALWRARMGTAWGKAIYKLRAQTAEWVNAETRNHGFQQMPVRGLKKCRIVAVLHAIAHNVFRAVRLCAAATAAGA